MTSGAEERKKRRRAHRQRAEKLRSVANGNEKGFNLLPHDPPVSLIGATDFGTDREVMTSDWVVRMLRQRPEISRNLIRDTTFDLGGPIERGPGKWTYAYLAYVTSHYVHYLHFWIHSDETLWKLCDFEEKPALKTVYARFNELENASDAFDRAAAKLIQLADLHSGGLATRDIHTDSTQSRANARLVHACRPWECNREEAPKRRTSTATAQDVREGRLIAAELDPDDEILLAEEQTTQWDAATGRMRKQFGKNGCFWTSADPDAGVRTYSRNGEKLKSWTGYYNHKAISHYTGAPTKILVTAADVQEYNAYPELIEGHLRNAGGAVPRAIVSDRGLSVSSVFEFNTTRGIATVAAHRGKIIHSETADCDAVPRCQHCGAPARHVRFHPSNSGKPRLWFECTQALPDTACTKVQSVYCEQSWRKLVPLSPLEPAYQSLIHAQSEYERVHIHFRQRYNVGGDTFMTCLKRRGIPAQQLRANAAVLVEWMRICFREGWLGSPQTSKSEVQVREASGWVYEVKAARKRRNWDKPYGTAAGPDAPQRPDDPEPNSPPPASALR